MKVILVRYGELTLKGANRNDFISKLLQNLKFKIKPYKDDVKFIRDRNSLTLEVTDEKLDKLIFDLQHTFGIYSVSIVKRCEKNLEDIKKAVLEITRELPNSGTFKLEVMRKDKSFEITSSDLKLMLAPIVLKNSNLKVDVHKPNYTLEIIVKSDAVYIFSSKINAIKGLPVGVSGKAISLLSGGIDSPVSSYLTLKRGMQVDFLHFMTPPHTSELALKKIFDLAEKLSPYNLSNFHLYVCNFSMLLQELMHIPEEAYRITIMRRMFVRITDELAKIIKAKVIVTGESLGQVASQTIESINVINEVSELPIIRPLITYDKEEIIAIAKKIKTYNISILPFDDVCSMYAPKKPVTKPKSFVAKKQEDSILWKEMIEWAIKNSIQKYSFKDGVWHEIKNWQESETK
ncbi:tRNA uracil 4-sulfurtransferase ThiI [Spiroplasma endosymbiont of Labia minor]|uniref:tRNA uracil 4-sulfurtransferase ThiI n=1 Tax=Spiroplasma endosymbiont of Labia minor TaxID=3066305 RepID=UPI0030D4E4FA